MKKIFDCFNFSLKKNFNSVQQTKDEYLSRAKTNAIEYIYDKYHMKAKILSLRCHFIPDPNYFWNSDELSGLVIVTMKHQELEFEVIVHGDTLTRIGYDNYQYQQLKDDYCQYIGDLMGKRPDIMTLTFQEKNDIPVNMLSKKYDGNLLNYLQNIHIEAVLNYVNYNRFQCIQKQNLMYRENTNILILNVRDVTLYRKLCEKVYIDHFNEFSDFVYFMSRYCCFYKGYYLIEDGKSAYYEYEMNICDDIQYVCFDAELKYPTTLRPKMSITEFPEEIKLLLKQRCDATEFGLALQIDSDRNERASIYLPPGRLEGTLDVLHGEPAYFVHIYKNEWNEYSVVKIHDVHYIYGYYHLNLWTKDCYFGMIKSKRK